MCSWLYEQPTTLFHRFIVCRASWSHVAFLPGAPSVQPYSISSAGPTALSGYSGANGATRLAALEALLAQSHPDPEVRWGLWRTLEAAMPASAVHPPAAMARAH